MKKLVFALLIMLLFTSCKSFQKITSKDNSTSTSKKARENKTIEFIEGIEITPGNVVMTKHKPSTTKSKTSTYEVPTYLFATSKVEIEKVNNLQLKYAIILDTYIENISNIKLFFDIEEWWGTSYCLGGSTKNCTDCSAFTNTIIKNNYQINLPRTASEQYNVSTRIETEELKEGDLVFFKTSRNYINHVGVYLVNNKFVHASTSQGVTISDLDESYWKYRFAGCGRIIN